MGKIALFLFFFFSWKGLAMEYSLKLPVASTARVEESNGILTIDVTFKPTYAFSAQLNRQVDYRRATRICQEAIRRYFNIDKGSIAYSGLQSVGTPIYSNESACYTFSVPKKAVRIIIKSTIETTANVSPSHVPEAGDSSSGKDNSKADDVPAKEKNTIQESIPSTPSNVSPSRVPEAGDSSSGKDNSKTDDVPVKEKNTIQESIPSIPSNVSPSRVPEAGDSSSGKDNSKTDDVPAKENNTIQE